MVAAPSFALPALYQLQQLPHPNPKTRKSAGKDNNTSDDAEFARFLDAFLEDEEGEEDSTTALVVLEGDLAQLPPGPGARSQLARRFDNNHHDPAFDLAPLVAAHLADGGCAAGAAMTAAAATGVAACPRLAASTAAGHEHDDDPLLLLHSAPSCGHEAAAARDANDLSGLFDAAVETAAHEAAATAAWAVAAAAPPPPPPPLMASSSAPFVAAGGATQVPTTMPMMMMAPAPHAPRNADDDCDSVATLPMPHKKRRRGSSPGPAASQDANNAPGGGGGAQDGADSRPAPAAGRSPRRRYSASASGRAATATPPPPLLAAPTPGAAVRAVLVAKVLTRSDATSKRIILPRVAIEANLAPQLASPSRPGASLVGTTFEFLARDAEVGSTEAWPMVIKAWANGSNPKPVYVLEQVASLLAARRLGVGDAVGILADRVGNFFVAVNTAEVRAAAARPTCAAFTFAQADAAEAAAAAAQQAEAEAEAEAEEAKAAAAAAEEAAEAAPAPAPAAAVAPPPAPEPVMMVAGGDTPSASVGRALFLSLDEADGAPLAAAAPAAPAVEVVPPTAPGAAPTMHVAGQLVCARTSGCKRPAGHQGWCYCK